MALALTPFCMTDASNLPRPDDTLVDQSFRGGFDDQIAACESVCMKTTTDFQSLSRQMETVIREHIAVSHKVAAAAL